MTSATQSSKYWFDYPQIRGFYWTYRKTHAHSGIDVGAPCGTKLISGQNGSVISVHQHPWGGQVNLLMDFPDPYAQNGHATGVVSLLHLQRLPNLSPGAPVYVGTDLGDSGQPPPGGRYGSGCHVHVETSAGTIPPYEGQYDPWYPTATSYPIDPNGLLTTWIAGNGGGAGGGGGGSGGSKNACGDPPNPLTDPAGYASWLACTMASAFGAGISQVPIVAQFNQVKDWLNPIRVAKLVVGAILVLGAVFLTFIPDVAGVALSAAGQPELGAAVSASASKRQTGRENIVRRLASGASEQYTGTKLAQKRAVASERAVREARTPKPPPAPKAPKPPPVPKPRTDRVPMNATRIPGPANRRAYTETEARRFFGGKRVYQRGTRNVAEPSPLIPEGGRATNKPLTKREREERTRRARESRQGVGTPEETRRNLQK